MAKACLNWSSYPPTGLTPVFTVVVKVTGWISESQCNEIFPGRGIHFLIWDNSCKEYNLQEKQSVIVVVSNSYINDIVTNKYASFSVYYIREWWLINPNTFLSETWNYFPYNLNENCGTWSTKDNKQKSLKGHILEKE